MTQSRAARGALLGLLAIVLLGTLAFLFSRTEAIDFKRDAETLSLLRELKDLDARWDADASRYSTILSPGPAACASSSALPAGPRSRPPCRPSRRAWRGSRPRGSP